jgi:hypothetical protein
VSGLDSSGLAWESFTFRLWNEERHRLVGFSHLGNLRETPHSIDGYKDYFHNMNTTAKGRT